MVSIDCQLAGPRLTLGTSLWACLCNRRLTEAGRSPLGIDVTMARSGLNKERNQDEHHHSSISASGPQTQCEQLGQERLGKGKMDTGVHPGRHACWQMSLQVDTASARCDCSQCL